MACGALMQVDGITVIRSAVFLGDCTNNEAEYQGALAVLRHALTMRCTRIHLFGESEWVVNELTGAWKCKSYFFEDVKKNSDRCENWSRFTLLECSE